MTGVIALEIDTASAKIADSGVEDEDDDYEIPIWSGVLPITTSIGSPVDDDRSSSRRHAKLYLKDGTFWVVEEIGTTNGTFVNGVRLEAGQPLRVAAGDELRFGLVELVLADDSQR